MVQSVCLVLAFAGGTSLEGTGPDSGNPATAIIRQLEAVEDLRYKGAYGKGIDLAREALTLATELESPVLEVEAIYQLSLLYYYQHDYSLARAEMQVGLARSRVHELEELEADFLAAEGVLEWKQGNLHLALPKLQQAMRIRERRGNFLSMASISNNVGIIYYTLGNYEDAEFYYREALELLKKEENERLRSSLYINLSEVLIPMDRLVEAENLLRQALELEQELQDPQSLAYIHFNLGELASRKTETDLALSKFKEALALQEQIGDTWAIALTRLRMSGEYFNQNDLEQSLQHAEAGYRLAMGLNALSLLRDFSAHLVKLYGALGESGRVQFFSDQHAWLDQRVSLENLQEEPVVSESVISQVDLPGDTAIFPFQGIILTMVGTMILILVMENTRLRVRMRNL